MQGPCPRETMLCYEAEAALIAVFMMPSQQQISISDDGSCELLLLSSVELCSRDGLVTCKSGDEMPSANSRSFTCLAAVH